MPKMGFLNTSFMITHMKKHYSNNYNKTVSWDNGYTCNYNEYFQVEKMEDIGMVYPSPQYLKNNKETRVTLGGGNQAYRYATNGEVEFYVDFEAKAFWREDFR